MSIETTGENAPGNRSSLPLASLFRSSTRFSPGDLLVRSISENAHTVARRASQFLRRQPDIEARQLFRFEACQALGSAKEIRFLLGSQYADRKCAEFLQIASASERTRTEWM